MRAILIGAFLMIAAIFGTMQVATAQTADGSCEIPGLTSSALTTLLDQAAEPHVFLSGNTLKQFTDSVEEQTGVSAPLEIAQIVGPPHETADGSFFVFLKDGCPRQEAPAQFPPSVYKKALEAAGFGPNT